VVEQENDDFYQTAAQTVRTCIQQSGIDPSEVIAIAFDSQMAGIGAVDEDFNPAIRFDSWLDMRCQPYIELINREFSDLVTRLTGAPPTCDHGPKIVWWKDEEPESYRRIVKFLTPSGYVAGKMAGLRGEDAFMDYTFIHFSALSDAQSGTWSDELCQLLGVDKAKLPRIVDSIPVKRLGRPEDVARAVLFFAARDASFITGQTLFVCGGTSVGSIVY
jgi:xylulokinase